MSTWRDFFKILLFLVGYLVAITILIALQFGLEAAKILPTIELAGYFIVAHVVGMIVFFYLLYRAFSYPESREAKTNGLAATAEVLEAKRTGWRTRRKRSFRRIFDMTTTPRRWEYKLRVRVAPPEGEAYEVTLFEYFLPAKEPTVGMTLSVKIHPQRPEVVVLADEQEQK